MATWKCEVKMKLGKYSAHVWRASEGQSSAIADGVATSKDAVEKVLESVKKAGFAEGEDEIIFRDNAYATLNELRYVMSRAPY
jgi:hypothetical protein